MDNEQEEQFNEDQIVDPKTKSFTKWENEPTVRDLKQDYEEAKPIHDAQVAKIDKWLDNLNITGSAVREKKKGRSNIQPKLIRKQAEWRYASLSEPFLSTDDLFNTAPVTWEDKEASVQNGLILNHQFNNQINKVKFIDDYVHTAVDEGTVIVRVGWDYEEDEVEVEVPITELVPVQDPVKAQMMLAQGIQPIEEIQIGTEVQIQTKVVKNQPTVEVCNYNNVTVDPTCQGDISKASFIIYSFETSLSELEKDGRYINLDSINVDNNSILSEPDRADISEEAASFTFKDKPRKKFIAYEYWGYWDINNTGIAEPIVATWVGDTLIRMEENPFPDKSLPFVIVQYLPKRFSVYGEPDGELLEDNQKIVGAITRGMIDMMARSANGQVGSRKDALDLTNRRKFERGQDYEFNAQVDPRQAFYMHTYPEIPQSAAIMLEMQNNEAESLTGVKAFYSGISGNALGSTATGVRSALDATSKRELSILRRLADGVKQIGYKIISMNSEFLSDEEIIRVTNDEFVTIKREALAGRIDLRLDISTPEVDNEKAQELAFMLQTMGNNMDPSMSKIILEDIARLRKMPDLAKQIHDYQPQPDPIAEQMKQLELQKLQMEIQKIQSEARENMAQAMLDEAKARHTQSLADKTDLDFVEQESGVHQERELQRQGEQARANMVLKAMEAGLKAKERKAS